MWESPNAEAPVAVGISCRLSNIVIELLYDEDRTLVATIHGENTPI